MNKRIILALCLFAVVPVTVRGQVYVSSGGYVYQAVQNPEIQGSYLYGGFLRILPRTEHFSWIGFTGPQVAPSSGQWGVTGFVGGEFYVKGFLLDAQLLWAKDIGPERGTWLVGPGTSILRPLKSGGLGLTFGYVREMKRGGLGFLSIGLAFIGKL